ncbi:extensin family protein [Arvimicrobium flavum]|uniref:extensin-like domain-containing protein n=1 Tax=Arvimicrobium flavum TaxID=3393320 RepID=UPI00237A3343|nr:extensin family protein [Mesorhizobium shangrilense]
MAGNFRGARRQARQGTARIRLPLAALALLAISACTSGDVMELRPQVDVESQTSATFQSQTVQSSLIAPPRQIASSQPIEPPQLIEPLQAGEPPQLSEPVMAGYPRMDAPADIIAPMSADDLNCRKQLKKLGVVFRELDPINDGGACHVEHPVKVSRIGSVHIRPAATLNCEMAEAFAAWTRNELVPASRWRFFSGVKAIHQGSSYSCRNIAGTRGTPSEHSAGNAIDIMKIELNSGKKIDVRKPGLFAFRKRGLLNTVRADGCEYFTTVLGPGYNADHADHFHFDIKSRRNGYRACR